MTSTRESKWPPLRLPDKRLGELQLEAAVADRNPLMALAAQTKLLAAGGHFTQARKLSRLLESEYPMEQVDQGAFMRLFPLAILAHDPDLAESWLKSRYHGAYQIAFDVAPAGLPVDVAIMRVDGDRISFRLSHALFNFYAGDMILGRLAVTFALFDAFMKSDHRRDGSVAVNLLDLGSWPGLAFCDYRPGYYLIPDPHYMIHDQYNQSRTQFRAHEVAWDDRAPIAYWRGSTSGMPTDPAAGWRSLPRIRLCEIAAANPDIIDAGITAITQIEDGEASAWLEARNLMRQRVPSWSYQQYRYQIDIDGNTNAWDGLVLRLLTGSPVLKVASPRGFEQWYYPRLKPWVNFVPIETNMADLVEKVNWLRANDDQARKIGEAGRALGESLDQREIDRSLPVIAAAIRAASGGPLLDLRFAAASPDNAVLRSGWRTPRPDGVPAAATDTRLTLPGSPGLGDYVLMAEVSAESGPPRRMTMVANGETLLSHAIAERTTVYCPLPRSVAASADELDLKLHFPDSTMGASATNAIGDGLPGVILHRIGVAAAEPRIWAGYANLAALLADLNTARPSSVIHDLAWQTPERPPVMLPPGAKPRALHTCFGTLLYADQATGRVRHGHASSVPRNLFLIPFGGTAVLARAKDDGGYVAVRIRPEGRHASNDAWTFWAGGGFARTFAMVGTVHETFALQAAGLFACAEYNGEFTLSRPTAAEWESFHFEQDGP